MMLGAKMLFSSSSAQPVDYWGLCFTAEEDGAVVNTSVVGYGGTLNVTLQTSKNGKTWKAFDPYGSTPVTLKKAGDKVFFRAGPNGNTTFCVRYNGSIGRYVTFSLSKRAAASGNIMSLLNADENASASLGNECFYYLFYNCAFLTQAPDLPATSLTQYCYRNMFYGCTSLVSPPVISATYLAPYCCKGMFQGCTSLTAAPALPATSLATECYYYMFQGCTSLSAAPALPATTLASYCYYAMFSGCTSLTDVPELPATSLGAWCYYHMFSGCTSLVSCQSILPATELANECYDGMFQNCTKLSTCPVLPALSVSQRGYSNMFNGCTSLLSAPELPATALGPYCYADTFNGCSNLSCVPDLPATELTSIYCYSGMFKNCKALTDSPHIFAKALSAGDCCKEMFYGCSKLSSVEADIVAYKRSGYNSNSYTYNWLYDVAPSGVFICPYNITNIDPAGSSGIPAGWTVKYQVTSRNDSPLCFTAKQPNSSVKLQRYGNPPIVLLEMSYNRQTWSAYSIGTSVNLPEIDSKFYLRAKTLNDAFALDGSNYYKFAMTGKISVSGQLYSIVGAAQSTVNVTVSSNCFYKLFDSCSALIDAPHVDRINIADHCFDSTFQNCTSLAKAPRLTNTSIISGCYDRMFKGCSSLSSIEVDFSEWADNIDWLDGVAQTGEFVCHSMALPIEYGPNRIPVGWQYNPVEQEVISAPLCFTAHEANSTVQLSGGISAVPLSLEQSLDCQTWVPYMVGDVIQLANAGDKAYLRASAYNQVISPGAVAQRNVFNMTGKIAASGSIQSLVGRHAVNAYAFSYLFCNNASLVAAPELPATSLAAYCYQHMFDGCTSLLSAPELPATSLGTYCYQYMFNGCTSLSSAQQTLPATSLPQYCYQRMFQDCSSLVRAPALPAKEFSSSVTRSYVYMFSGCQSLSSIQVGLVNFKWSSNTNNWLRNVAPAGVFICPTELGTNDTISRGVSYCPNDWVVVNI